MTPSLDAPSLFSENQPRLQLTWIAGKIISRPRIHLSEIRASTNGMIGHLNFIHPNWIQVLGQAETQYVNSLPAGYIEEALPALHEKGIACFIISDEQTAPINLIAFAEEKGIPVFSSPLQSLQLMWLLRHYLARSLAESTTLHGVMLDVLGMGVLLTGESGVGKSELALELVSRGSGLVADDVVEFYRIGPETLEGRCPDLLRDFLEVRGLGILNIRTIFGEAAMRPRKNLKLLVHLEKQSLDGSSTHERLPLSATSHSILEVNVHKVVIPVVAGRNLAVLVEAAVRNTILQMRGIDSTHDFVARQERILNA